MWRKVIAVLICSTLAFGIPVSFVGCGSSSKGTTTLTDKQKKDAEYGKKLMDGVDNMKKNGTK